MKSPRPFHEDWLAPVSCMARFTLSATHPTPTLHSRLEPVMLSPFSLCFPPNPMLSPLPCPQRKRPSYPKANLDTIHIHHAPLLLYTPYHPPSSAYSPPHLPPPTTQYPPSIIPQTIYTQTPTIHQPQQRSSQSVQPGPLRSICQNSIQITPVLSAMFNLSDPPDPPDPPNLSNLIKLSL